MYAPHFTITNKILKNVGIIEGAREVILNAPLLPAWEAKFREEAIIRTVHHGTHIEGNNLNYSEAAKVIAGQQVVARPRDIQEVINYRNVLLFLEKLYEKHISSKSSEGETTTEPNEEEVKAYFISEIVFEDNDEKKILEKGGITSELILYLHQLTTEKILPAEQSGRFRKTQVVIKNAATGEITFRPPPAIEVPFQMDEYVEWLAHVDDDDSHPVLKAGIAQYELVRIHPFVDGNGRVARALAMLVLFLEGYDIRRFFSLEEYYDHNAKDYYEALQSVDTNVEEYNVTPWLEYFCQGLAIELTRVKEKVLKLSTDMHLKEKLGGKQIFLSPRQIKLVEHIQKVGFLQNRMYFELFPMVSEDTVLRELKDLVDKGVLKKVGVTKAARYVLK